MRFLYFCLFFHAWLVGKYLSSDTKYEWEYIIVGAGPAGLQMGYFLEESGRDYIIVERNNESGSFFRKYPRHDRLISINKRFTGKLNQEFNFRHDWNSLLTHNLLRFTDFSTDFFPRRKQMRDYLYNYSKIHNLNILYNTNILNINKINNIFRMDADGRIFKCKHLIVASGLNQPVLPNFEGGQDMIGYEEMPLDEDFYKGKDVLILGNVHKYFK